MPVTESWTHGSAAALLALVLAVAAADVSGDRPRTARALLLAATVLASVYYVVPVRGESPIATVVRVLGDAIHWHPWRSRAGAVLLAAFIAFPALVLVMRGRRLSLCLLGAMIVAVLYRSLVGLEGAAGILSTAASIVVLATVVFTMAGAVSVLVRAGAVPNRRAAAILLAPLSVAATAEWASRRSPNRDMTWSLGPTTDEADRLFGRFLPAWNDERAQRDFYGRRSPELPRRSEEIVSAARSIDVRLAAALRELVTTDRTVDVPSLSWYRLVADVNEASRLAGLPYYVDPTAEVQGAALGFMRWFRLDTYRIEAVRHFRADDMRLTTLHVRSLTPERGGPSVLGLSRDAQPFAVVVLSELQTYRRQMDRLAAMDPPRCVEAGPVALDDDALLRCGLVLRSALAGDQVDAELALSVERHELQHQIDGPSLSRSRLVLHRHGALDRDVLAQLDREIGGYLAQITVAPRLSLVRLLQLGLVGESALARQTALLTFEALTGEVALTPGAGARAFGTLVEQPEETLRARSRGAYRDLFGRPLVEVRAE